MLGLLALRRGLIDEPRRHVRLIASWMAFGFASWALSWAVLFQLPEGQFAPIDWQVRYGFGIVTEQWLCFTFIGGMILLLAFRPQWRSRLEWVGTAGRMALTNYMLQAAALDFIVSGYGLSLRLRPAAGMVAAGAPVRRRGVVLPMVARTVPVRAVRMGLAQPDLRECSTNAPSRHRRTRWGVATRSASGCRQSASRASDEIHDRGDGGLSPDGRWPGPPVCHHRHKWHMLRSVPNSSVLTSTVTPTSARLCALGSTAFAVCLFDVSLAGGPAARAVSFHNVAGHR